VVYTPVFVQESATYDILLGRNWQDLVRFSSIAGPNQSVVCTIESMDGSRRVEFYGVKPNHERNKFEVRLTYDASCRRVEVAKTKIQVHEKGSVGNYNIEEVEYYLGMVEIYSNG